MAKKILSSDKIHTLHHKLYEPDIAVKCTLLIVHGMCEHSRRYDEFAKYLSDKGVAVLAYDQLGHGCSINHGDELGYFAKKHPMQLLLRDVVLMANVLKKKHPNVPHFIMGHSMGSFIVRNVLQVHSSEFSGAILMGTSDTNPLAKRLIPITKALNTFNPKQRNRVYASVTNKMMNRKLKDKLSDSKYAWLCKNQESLKKYEADPLCGFDFTNNGYWALFNLMNTGLEKNWAETIEHDFPMLFISGEDDSVGNMGKGIRKLTKRLKKEGFSHIEQILYPDMRHEPLHEDGKDKVFDDMLNWIEKTTTSK